MHAATTASFAGVIVALLLAHQSATLAYAQPTPAAPEAAGPVTANRPTGPATARRWMVVTANPLASEAGRRILRDGGSAVDAAIAVQLVLGLVEPQSSGLGGGAFLLHWNASRAELKTYDGRETAPAAARPDRFLSGGRPMPFAEAVQSGLSVGVPGVARLLETVHRAHGRLPWDRLFKTALKLADDGFPVSPRLHALLTDSGPQRFAPIARNYFFDRTGRPHAIGSRLPNPDYARTLRQLQASGARALHEGPIASAIAAAVAADRRPGDLTVSDLSAYAVHERSPVCFAYRSYRICCMGPPSSGGYTLAQALTLLDGFDVGRSPAAATAAGPLHLTLEALKLAFADRAWYVADSDFAPVPSGLLDAGYLARRRDLISPMRAAAPYPGIPPARYNAAANGQDGEFYEEAGTSHISIIDGEGNAVAMTTSIEAGFGSGIWAAGFLLNNQLTDFSPAPRDSEGRPIANRVEPGKRPRSSMSPTLVFSPDGRLFAVLGSAGGSRIIPYVLKTILAVIDWKLDAQQAVALPNFSAGNGAELEAPPFSMRNLLTRPSQAWRAWRLAMGMAPLGQHSRFAEMTSGTNLIVRRPDGTLEGGSDPRREGVALGD